MKTFGVSFILLLAVAPAAPAGLVAEDWRPAIERIGWTLVHSVWQLAAVALIAAIVDRGTRHCTARVRYIAAAVSLGMMLVLPAVTWTLIAVERGANAANRSAANLPVSLRDAATDPAIDARNTIVEPHSDYTDPGDTSHSAVVIDLPTSVPAGSVEPTTPLPEQASATVRNFENRRAVPLVESRFPAWRNLTAGLRTAIEPRLHWLVALWLAGVGLCSLRPIFGVWTQWRLQHFGLSPVPDAVLQALLELVRKMQIVRAVRISQSALVGVPMVVGYLWPIILLPASVVTDMTPMQLEAILAHELAHVRRHDWLINVLQIVAETVFFYHPAVWWLSRRLRRERELCCDDLALGLIHDKAVFARSLLRLEELCHSVPSMSTASPTLAATGGRLTDRVRRLLAVDPDPGRAAGGWLTGAILVLALGVAGGLSLRAAQQEDADRNRISRAEAATPAPDDLKGEPEDEGNTAQPIGDDRPDEIVEDAVDPGKAVTDDTPAPKEKEREKRIIRVRAVDSEHRVLKDAVPQLHSSRSREFKLQGDGTFTSPVLTPQQKLLRIAAAQEKGPMLFSDLVDINTTKPGEDGVLQLVLRPGTRLEGRLDDSVPRPISEGYVGLAIVETENHKVGFGGWVWNDFAVVRPDGTFTFESLPGGGCAQLHAMVDGYISKNPPLETLREYLREHNLADAETIKSLTTNSRMRSIWPQLALLDQPRVTVTIECEPTASCDFRLVDPSGKPVPDATVHLNPHGAFLGWSFYPGTETSHALVVDAGSRRRNRRSWFIFEIAGTGQGDFSPHGQEWQKRHEWAERSFRSVKSDADGRAQIRNLPGSDHERFHVEANGLVLPISPLIDDDRLAKLSPADANSRYGIADLVLGETAEKTIYLERVQTLVNRELLVVDDEGAPLADVSLALAEMRVGAKDWQTWSTQRFGTLPKGTTDKIGRVVLRIPKDIAGVPVEQIRVGVNFDGRKHNHHDKLPIHGSAVDLPLKPDDGVIVIQPNREEPPSKGITLPASATYGRLEEVLPKKSPAELLDGLIKQPNLAVLRRLLAASPIKHPEPIDLLFESRHLRREQNGQVSRVREQKSRIEKVNAGQDSYVIVTARVRPMNGLRSHERDPDELPECAYVFDRQGNLLAALGGGIGITGEGSPEEIRILNIGPQEDWFVCVDKYEKHGPFETQSTYYRLAKPIVNSLRCFSALDNRGRTTGPMENTRWGLLTFQFPTPNDDDDKTLGTTAEGVATVPAILWDADRNRFVGSVSLRDGNKPLYQVDTEWSRDFDAVSPKSDQMIIAGGEQGDCHCYHWETAVPKGFEALVTLSLPQREGPPRTIARKLSAGRQNIDFLLEPIETSVKATLTLGLDGERDQKKPAFDIPFQLGDRPAIQPPIRHTLNPNETVRLLNRSLKSSTGNVTIDVKLSATR